jgi:hypothetical protein
MELKTARLTVLIDPAKKEAFEELCRQQDMTPSQVVRRLIRDFMEDEEGAVAARSAARAAPAARAAKAVKKVPAAAKKRR